MTSTAIPANSSGPDPSHDGVSFVIPVHNGARWLEAVLESVLCQGDGRPMEVLAVEDGSSDSSPGILADYEARGLVRVIAGPRRGATAALNEGIRQARYPIICQVDQDVVLDPAWMKPVLARLTDPRVAAVQGHYANPVNARIWSRVMGLDLEQRYRRIGNRNVDHVCTGNTAYRANALRDVGLFDERLGYGYDNDISYRLVQAGYALRIEHESRATHWWRDSLVAYFVQQYGFGYGRLDLIAKHRHRIAGDDVSGAMMMLHAPLMAAVLSLMVLAWALALAGVNSSSLLLVALAGLSALAVERLGAGLLAVLTFRDTAGFFFLPVHLVRDVAWASAILMWLIRRMKGGTADPFESMRPRSAAGTGEDSRG